MSFFQELKRRNVVKVGIAYVVAAWLLLQLTDVLSELLELDTDIGKIVILLLIIGFVPALIFAWAFEMTPEGIKREHEVDRSQSITQQTGRKLDFIIIGILTVAVGYLLVDKLVLQKGVEPAPATAQVQATQEVDSASVAVLPFVNMSNDEENEYFSDGLTETLLHMLAQLPDLRVAARTSSFAFKGQNKSITEVASTLGVAHVLEGSVQKAGDRVRVTAQLIRADDGFHVWSQNYTRPLQDIFAIQDEIATDVAGALGSSLLGTEDESLHGVETQDLTAYDSYLKGLEQQAIFSYSSLEEAEDHFGRALTADPEFLDARLALIRNYMNKRLTGLLTDEELQQIARPLIEQVRQQQADNKLARAYELLLDGRFSGYANPEKEIEESVSEMMELLSYIPTDTFIRTSVAGGLNWALERPEEAIAVVQAGLLIDPMSPELHDELATIYLDQDRLDEAYASLTKIIELAPEIPTTYSRMSFLEEKRNNLVGSLNWRRKSIEMDPQDHELPFGLALTLYRLDLPEEAGRWHSRVQDLEPGSALARQLDLRRASRTGEKDLALEMARQMIEDEVDGRFGSHRYAVFVFSHLMMEAGRSKEAYDFLASKYPQILETGTFVEDWRARDTQIASLILMSSFAPAEERLDAWNHLKAAEEPYGFDWLNPGEGGYTLDRIFNGDIEAAVQNEFETTLAEPVAENLLAHETYLQDFFGPVDNDPRIVASYREREAEYQQFRSEVQAMLQEPEWDQ